MAPSKVLVIGGTGYIGKFIVGASVKLGYPTLALVRDTAPSDEAKVKVLDGFKSSGVTLVKGDLYDHESLVNAIKQADVVISAVGARQLFDQTKIIDAIKEAGNVKRFIPSEFGFDVDRAEVVEPAKFMFALKSKVRRAIELAGIPYTIICSNAFAGYTLPALARADEVFIYGDGNTKAIFASEEDIGTFTIKAVDDSRTLNKIVYMRPSGNIYTHNELVSLWEKKSGKTLKRVYLTEEQVLKKIAESPMPLNAIMAVNYSLFLKGVTTNFKIDESIGVEATELFADVKYTTVDEYLSRFV